MERYMDIWIYGYVVGQFPLSIHLHTNSKCLPCPKSFIRPALLWAQKAPLNNNNRGATPTIIMSQTAARHSFLRPRLFRASRAMALCSPPTQRFRMDFAVIPRMEKYHIEMSIRSPSPKRWIISYPSN